jgi:hypothetical protein
MDLPVMENIQNAINTFKYADGDSVAQNALIAGAQFAGSAASGMIPAPISQIARITDDYYRDTTGDNKTETAYNALLNSLPYFRNQLPVKTDNFGNAKLNEPNMYNRVMNSLVRPGAINTFQESAVQKEIARVYEATGDVSVYPDRKGVKSITVGKTKYDLTADEQREYHSIAGKKSEQYVKSLMRSEFYQGLDDEQKAAAIKEAYGMAEGVAKAKYLEGKEKDYSNDATKLLHGVEKPGDTYDRVALNESNLAKYIAFKIGYDDAVENGDYTAIDSYVKSYSTMDSNLKKVAGQRIDDLENLDEYRKNGMNSATFYEVTSSRKQAQVDLDQSVSTSATTRLLGLAYANIPEKEKTKIVNNIEDYIGSNGKAAYNTLHKLGMDTASVYDFFNTALNCKTWKDSGEPVDANGKLSADATAYALSQMKGLTDEQRVQAFNEIKSQVSNYYNDWGNYTYQSEISYINRPSNKATYSKPSNRFITTNTQSTGSGIKLGSGNPLFTGQGQQNNSNYLLQALGIAG